MDNQPSKMSVLMLPRLAHGHATPFLELAKRLIERNFFIYFCSTPIILTCIKEKLNEKQSHSIQLVELHLPPSPELPPHLHTTNGLPPHLTTKLMDALDIASASFSLILEEIKPDLVIYDDPRPWTLSIASSHKIPGVKFSTIGASTLCLGLHMTKYPEKEFPCKKITPRYIKSYNERGRETSHEAVQKTMFEIEESVRRSTEILLVTSFKELEDEYLDYLSVVANKRVVPVGPMIGSPSATGDGSDDEIMMWLEKKDESSTVFVSFGSECYLQKEEIQEFALGLELSNVNFLWILRFPVGDETKIEDVLPKGFLERVGERGKVWKDWAPQTKILAHSSISGFMSHCGLKSIMESLGSGIPIIAVPMQTDQPCNARLIEDLGVAIEVPRDMIDCVLKGEEIAKTIRKVMVEKDGESVRNKAREFRDIIQRKGEEMIDLVVKELTELCKKGK